jgi:hypothetical protein
MSLDTGITIFHYFRVELVTVNNFQLERYFRLEPFEQHHEDEDVDEVIRLEITEDGEIDEVFVIERDDSDDEEWPWAEVIGLSLTSLSETKSAQTVALEIVQEDEQEDL